MTRNQDMCFPDLRPHNCYTYFSEYFKGEVPFGKFYELASFYHLRCEDIVVYQIISPFQSYPLSVVVRDWEDDGCLYDIFGQLLGSFFTRESDIMFLNILFKDLKVNPRYNGKIGFFRNTATATMADLMFRISHLETVFPCGEIVGR